MDKPTLKIAKQQELLQSFYHLAQKHQDIFRNFNFQPLNPYISDKYKYTSIYFESNDLAWKFNVVAKNEHQLTIFMVGKIYFWAEEQEFFKPQNEIPQDERFIQYQNTFENNEEAIKEQISIIQHLLSTKEIKSIASDLRSLYRRTFKLADERYDIVKNAVESFAGLTDVLYIGIYDDNYKKNVPWVFWNKPNLHLYFGFPDNTPKEEMESQLKTIMDCLKEFADKSGYNCFKPTEEEEQYMWNHYFIDTELSYMSCSNINDLDIEKPFDYVWHPLDSDI